MSCRRHKHVEKVGKAIVTDETGFAWQCASCDEVEVTSAQLMGYERRAAAIVLRDGRHTTGSLVRYARKSLGLKQTELAVLLECTAEHISRLENGHATATQTEVLALVALLEGVENGSEDLKARLEQEGGDAARPSMHEFEVREPARRTG